MVVLVQIQDSKNTQQDEQAFGSARAAINWVKSHTEKALIKLDGHVAYKYDHGKLLWNNGCSFEQLGVN